MEEPKGPPAFLSQQAAEAAPYDGADDAPNFDRELDELPPLPGDVAPVGKGPSPGVRERYRIIARLHALGYTNNQIARHLGYSATGISLALAKPFVQDEIARVRAELFNPDVITRAKNMAIDSIDYLHRTVIDPSVKDEIRSTNARWGVEKLTGKPKQEVSVESGTLTTFMDLLKSMQSRGEVIDVTPAQPVPVSAAQGEHEIAVAAPQQTDKWSAWLDSNL